MFLLVSVRHVGAHPGELKHGVSIQISISLGKTFLRISRIRNIPLTWILARVFVSVPPFISQVLDFVYWTVLIFILIYFEWRDTENQQLATLWKINFFLVSKVKLITKFLIYARSRQNRPNRMTRWVCLWVPIYCRRWDPTASAKMTYQTKKWGVSNSPFL